MELAIGWCCLCDQEVDFERPACADHPEDCPERICTRCAIAYVGGQLVTHPAAMSTTPKRAAITPAA